MSQNSPRENVFEMRNAKLREIERHADKPPLDGGGSGPHDPGMETRVTRLEVEFEHVRRDLDEIKSDMKAIGARLRELPTKRDLSTNLQWIVATTFGVCFAVVAIFVGVLAYLQDQRAPSPPAPAPAPIIIQLPPQVSTPPSASVPLSPIPAPVQPVEPAKPAN